MKTNRTVLYLLVVGMVAVIALWLGFMQIPQPEIYDLEVRGNETVEELIRRIATNKGYENVDFALAIVRCESGFNPEALGDSGQSRGLWQIHSGYWPSISDFEAYSPEWSTNWAIDKLKTKNGYLLWTCARKIAQG